MLRRQRLTNTKSDYCELSDRFSSIHNSCFSHSIRNICSSCRFEVINLLPESTRNICLREKRSCLVSHLNPRPPSPYRWSLQVKMALSLSQTSRNDKSRFSRELGSTATMSSQSMIMQPTSQADSRGLFHLNHGETMSKPDSLQH